MSSERSTDCLRRNAMPIRQVRVVPLVTSLEQWMRGERTRLSRHADVAKAMDYMLKRWEAFTRFLDDGRICLTNNAAERALRGIALGRKAWLFAGSDRGGERAAAMYSLLVTAKLNDVDPRAWLADVLAPSPIIPSGDWTNCCLGTGANTGRKLPLPRKQASHTRSVTLSASGHPPILSGIAAGRHSQPLRPRRLPRMTDLVPMTQSRHGLANRIARVT